MAQFYNLISYQQAGDPWSNQFGTYQGFWAEFEGVEGGVLLNKKVGTTPRLGATYGDLIQATSQSGNPYWKFKSVQKPQGVQAPQFGTQPQPAQQTQPTQAPVQPQQQPVQGVVGDGIPGWAVPLYNMVEYIYKEMKKMDSEAPENQPQPAAPTPTPTPEPATKGVEQVGGAPLSQEEQAKLDDIFGAEDADPGE